MKDEQYLLEHESFTINVLAGNMNSIGFRISDLTIPPAYSFQKRISINY